MNPARALFTVAIAVSVAALVGLVVGAATTTHPADAPSEIQIVGQITDKALTESSGLIASPKHPGVFWTHNDSGNPPQLFAIDRSGKVLNRFPVAARNVDWEDIAADPQGRIYLADIGNNGAKRHGVQVYRLDEPDPAAANPKPLKPTAAWELLYPEKPFDAEALFILHDTGYLISKNFDLTAARVYAFSLAPAKGPLRLKPVATLPVHAPVTGADLSPDGARLAVQTVLGPFLFDISPGLDNARFLGHVTYADINLESVAFTANGLLATDEPGIVIFVPDGCFAAPPAPATAPADPDQTDRHP